MKTMISRLKSTCGESLIETMAAILIFTFASILFLSLTTAAADINLAVKEADELFQSQQMAIETESATPKTAQAILSFWNDADNDGIIRDSENQLLGEIPLERIESNSEDASLYAYEPKETTP